MSYISRRNLIDEILKEAVLAYDEDLPDNTPHHTRRPLASTTNAITDKWRTSPYTHIDKDWKEIGHSEGGGIHINQMNDFLKKAGKKLIIMPPSREAVGQVMRNFMDHGMTHEQSSSDYQAAIFAIYEHALRLFGLANTKPGLAKDSDLNHATENEAEMRKIYKRIEKTFARNTNWSVETPAEQVINDIYKSDSLNAMFFKDPVVGPIIKQAVREPDIENAFELKGYILDNIDAKTTKKDKRAKLTVLENLAARSINAVDMKMRKMGYKNGIMNVQNMFDYLERYYPERYSEILDTYELTPEQVKSFDNYQELCQWLYQPHLLVKVYNIVSGGGARHRLRKGELSKRSSLADHAASRLRIIRKGEQNISKKVPAIGTLERVEYYEKIQKVAAKALEEIKAKYKELMKSNREAAIELKNSIDYKKAVANYNNANTAMNKARAAYDAAVESGVAAESHKDKLDKKKMDRREFLMRLREHIDASLVHAFDISYPGIKREIKSPLPDDLMKDMYELSFSIVRYDNKPFGKEVTEHLEQWTERHFNEIEKENGFDGTIAVSVIPTDAQETVGLHYEDVEVLRIIFDYPNKSYMYNQLNIDDEKEQRYIIGNIQFDILEHLEEELEIEAKPYLGDGHGLAVNEPSADYLLNFDI